MPAKRDTAKKNYRATQVLEIAQRRRNVSRMYLSNRMTQQEIAQRLNLSQATVWSDLDHLKKLWIKNSTAQIGEIVALELARLEDLDQQIAQEFAYAASQQLRLQKMVDEGRLLSGADKLGAMRLESDLMADMSRQSAVKARLVETRLGILDRITKLLGLSNKVAAPEQPADDYSAMNFDQLRVAITERMTRLQRLTFPTTRQVLAIPAETTKEQPSGSNGSNGNNGGNGDAASD